MTRLAVLSDIHGNLPALEAILADIEKQGSPDAYWILGDLAAFLPWPVETLARLRDLPNAAILQGNTDRYLVTGRRPPMPIRSPEDWSAMPHMLNGRDANFRWTVELLPYSDYAFLRDLPPRLELDVPGYGRVLGVHAAPHDDESVLLADTPEAEILPHLARLDVRLMLYGHIHRLVDRTVGNIRLISAGSAGLPLDGDARPSYALLDFEGSECTLTLRRVVYDADKAKRELERVSHPAREWIVARMDSAAP